MRVLSLGVMLALWPWQAHVIDAFVTTKDNAMAFTLPGLTVIGINRGPTSSRLFGKWENYDPDHENSSFEDALARNKARTDLRNFLTQRSIQSFLYLLDQCRDPHTAAWVEVSGTITVP